MLKDLRGFTDKLHNFTFTITTSTILTTTPRILLRHELYIIERRAFNWQH